MDLNRNQGEKWKWGAYNRGKILNTACASKALEINGLALSESDKASIESEKGQEGYANSLFFSTGKETLKLISMSLS